MKKALSIFLCLAMLVSVIPANVLAAPTALIGGDTAYEATEEQGSLSAEGTTSTVTFDAGTTAAVSGMPQNTVVNTDSTYYLPTSAPTREGYLFEGWVKSLGSYETVTSSRIAEDTTFYAIWSKGGYMADFNNPGDTMDMSTGMVTLADGATMTVSQADKDTWALDTEKGEVFYKVNTGGKDMDFQFALNLPSNVFIHTSDIKEIIIAVRTDASAAGCISKVYYNTKNENNVNNGGLNELKTITNIPIALTGNIEDKIVTQFPASKVQDATVWTDYISLIRNNVFGTNAACSTASVYLDYIKVPGVPSVEYFDITAQVPVASKEKYGAEAFSSNGKFKINSVEWVGGEFVAENYFDGNAAYTVKIEVEAVDGYTLSDAPAAAVVNGLPATVVSNGETATITYTFPETDALVPVQVTVSAQGGVAEINEPWGTLQLLAAVRAPDGVPDKSVIWSIPEEYKKIATIDQNGVVSAIYNCEKLPIVATSKYDHKTTNKDNFTIKITNQSEPFTVTFDGGTNENVKNLFETVQEKGFYTLPADTATTTRSNYALKGWSKEVGGEIIKEDFITEDTTYYAVWGYVRTDDLQNKNATAFSVDNSDGTFTAEYTALTANNKVDPPTPKLNYATITPTNTDVAKGVILHASRESSTKTFFSSINGLVPLDDVEYMEVRTTLAPTDIELAVGIASAADEEGTNATELETVTYAGEALKAITEFDYDFNDGWYSYKVPATAFDNWENYLEEIKITFVKKDAEGNAVEMSPFKADFVRFVGRDIPIVDVELDAPVAATEFAGVDGVIPGHEGYEVADVEWTPALLDGKYFAGNTEYTAIITLNVTPGYFMFANKPYDTLVNGEKAEYKRVAKTDNKKATLTYTFEKTEDIAFELADITYYEKGDTGTVPTTLKGIVGDTIAIVDKVPENIPFGYRWIGWSFTDGGEILTDDVVIEGATDFYAVYEIIDSVDFSNEAHITDAITLKDGEAEFDGKWAIITPDGDKAAKITIDDLILSGDDYDYLEIVFDANRAERGEVNKFDENLVPEVIIEDGFGKYSPALEKTESVIANNTLSRKYIYNLTGDERTNSINTISVAPYKGTPVWAIASVKFIKNASLTEDIAITELEVPKTWETPDTEAAVNGNYAVKSIEWTTNTGFTADGSFDGSAVYTALIVIDTVPGYRIDTEVTTVNGQQPDSVVRNTDGTLTVSVTYPETEALADFELTVADAEISVAEGTVQLVPTFSADIPVKDVTWMITSNGDGGNSAVIDENGVVKASYDGVITVQATSVYDPTKTAIATVVITNQIEGYTIHFDPNTDGEVSGMPEDACVKYEYVLPNTPPVRDGFVFAGWVEKPGDKITVTKTYIEIDPRVTDKTITYYALWVKGMSIEFYNESIDSALVNKNGSMTNASYNEQDGTFTYDAANNPIIYLYNQNRDPLFIGKDNPIVEVRLKISKAGTYSICCWFESDDMYGNVLGPAYTGPNDRFMQNAYQYIKYDFSADSYKTIQFDFSGTADWVDGQPTYIRLDFPVNVTDTETLVTVDYIRAVSFETEEVEVTGVDTPVAKAIADTDAVAKDTSRYTVTGVAWQKYNAEQDVWEDGLLHDLYFDANSIYKALVTVKGASGYVMSSAPTTAKINGKDATIGAYNGTTGELTIELEFGKTADVDTSESYVVDLVSKDTSGEPVVDKRVVFAGEKLDISALTATIIPTGTRFIGWADTEDATLPNISGILDVTEDIKYYAVYEEITEFDFSNIYHRTNVEAKYGSTLSFDSTYAIITPAGVEAASALVTPPMNIDGTKFGKVELYFSATMDSTVDGIKYANKFDSALHPELSFCTEDDIAYNNVGTLIGAEKVIVDGATMFKYTYDMTTNANWNSIIPSLLINPYSNIKWLSGDRKLLYPAWGLARIKFIENVDAPAAEFEFAAPETWMAPATASDVACSDAFVVTDLKWTPAVDVFGAIGEYTAKLTYRANAGYKITDTAVTINGQALEAAANGDGTYTVSYKFPATEGLKDVEVIITGATSIKDPGRYVQLTGKTAAIDGSSIPMTDVVWSIEDGEEYAEISENGRVYPLANGVVTIKATSVYDEYVSATHEIQIENQKELYTVTFDKNTQAPVTGLPDPVFTSGKFVPEKYSLKREDGFFFVGWATDEDAVDYIESFTITADTTLYAKWSAGYEWSFDDDSTALNKNSTKTVTYNDGIATYVTTPGETPTDIVAASSGLTSLKLETAKHTTIAIRYSQQASASCIFYLQSGDGVSKSEWSEVAKVYQHGFSANGPGEYHTVSFDLTGHKVWHDYPYVEQVRYDNQSSHTNPVEIDWVRLYNNERIVEFDANGGLISMLGGEVASYKETTTNAKVITLPGAPVREGYAFLGWAKATEDYTKIYTDKFTVTDNVTLYAIWSPIYVSETEEAISIDVADQMVVGENQTIIVQLSGELNVTGDEGVVLSFVDENGYPQNVTISETVGNTIVFDLSGEGFEGEVTDIVLTLPTGTTDGLFVKDISFTTEDGVDDILDNGTSTKPTKPDVTTSVGGSDTEYPGFAQYPEYESNQIIGGPSFKNETDDSKTGTTPARPADEDIVMGGGKVDPGNEKFPFVNSYDNRFSDVTYSNWFFDDVVSSYDLGFMNGITDTTFDPSGTVTVAQAIAVAARIHATYNNAEIPAQATGEAWYQRYVNYAKSKYMITDGQFTDFTAPITREQIATLFVRVAPTSWFTKINDFTEIPDMGTNANVLRLYNAGIIVGVDDEYNFNGKANITRAEFSAVINRIALINNRIKVEFPEPEVEAAPVETPVGDGEPGAPVGEGDVGAEAPVETPVETPVEAPVETPEAAKA